MKQAYRCGLRRTLVFRLGLLGAVCALLLAATPGQAIRVKDITNIAGVRENQLVGYGVIVGLNGTGDGSNSQFTSQTVSNLLQGLGIAIDPNDIRVRNVAVVMLTATLPPFARAGSRIDVLASSLGDAKSLQGGTLLMTPLRAPNGQIYAVAQGAISVGGFAFGGNAGGGVQKNHPTVGQIANGALVEREVDVQFNGRDHLTLVLNAPDFTTIQRLVETINAQLGDAIASAVDSATVQVRIPATQRQNLVSFVARLENLDIEPDNIAKVVLDERTGTVVIGENVRVSTVAIAHGNLSIEIKETTQVSQPNPLARGTTVASPDTEVRVKEDGGKVILFPQAVTIRDLVRALNSIGVTTRDLISIFQAIKASGALQARLEIL